MPPIQLTAELEIGHSAIDDEHRKLLRFASQVSRAIEASRPNQEIALRIGILADSAQTHFRSEESLMLASGYDQYEAHKANHDSLLKEIQGVRHKLESGVVPTFELLDFYIRAWTTHHIVKFDLEFAKHLRSFSVTMRDGYLIV